MTRFGPINQFFSMNIESLIFWLCFVFCIALSAGAVMVIFRFERLKDVAAFRYLQYYTILVFTFGYYVLWGEFLLGYMPFPDSFKAAASVLGVVGSPFLVMALVIQLYWIAGIVKKKINRFVLPMLAAAGLGLVAAYLVSGRWELAAGVFSGFAVYGVYTSFVSVVVLATFHTSLLTKGQTSTLLAGLVLLIFIYVTPLLFDFENTTVEPIYIFFFFLINSAISVFFAYKAKPVVDEIAPSDAFKTFLKKYSFTQREAEIIREIYQGKSNQQIADTLFVTLQTVKDHTSRIYQKSDVKGRMQLLTLLREFETRVSPK